MINKIVKNIEYANWIFAKTMKQHPHWYSLRKTWQNDNDFVEFVLYIREHGYIEEFYGKKYKKFNINGYKYWTMGAPINNIDGTPCTILINRANVNYKSLYDVIAEKYDNMFGDNDSLKENERIMKIISPKGKLLDIGCGTGLFLDYVNYSEYLGIDISKKMLAIFKEKHKYANVINVAFEDFYGYKFDTIIALFGVPNYINIGKLKQIESDFLNNGGKAILMFFKDDYFPLTYIRSGIVMKHYKFDYNDWREYEVYDFNKKYIIVVIRKQ